ncbi:hypothetical protein OR16_31059 [Cupriavidus basilensis OR16]|uniref:DUF1853 family protein n=1 Tax=Cupriavidus basilensis OR16 TaxID=1127483 RepID=H1SD88_9BURK|nr:hypothetical protein OR16_31059 [Cupriavidus basilensis OR16]
MPVREPRPEFALSPGGAIEMAPLWRHAASQRLRELAWCSLSPPLLAFLPTDEAGSPIVNGNAPGHSQAALARWPEGALAAWQRWLPAADPAALPPTIAELAAGLEQQRVRGPSPAPSLRLGRHAERLLQFTLEHTEGLELLAANLPVRRAGAHGVQTLGELDFVWRDVASDATVHWEMAAKFYLLVEPAADGAPRGGGPGAAALDRHCFVGPNLVDRLGDKLEHIVRRQLSLSRTPEALALLGRRSTAARSTCSAGCSTATAWCRRRSAAWASRPITCTDGGRPCRTGWPGQANGRGAGARTYRQASELNRPAGQEALSGACPRRSARAS